MYILYRVKASRRALNRSCKNFIYTCKIPPSMDQGIMQPVGVKVTIRGRGELLLLFVSLLSRCQAPCASVMCDNRPYLLLLCATIPVIGDNATAYPSLAVASVEACDAKKSSKARRAIMPRLALRPVLPSSR